MRTRYRWNIRSRMRARMTASIALAVMIFMAPTAWAVTYFDGPHGFGFEPPKGTKGDFRIGSAEDWRPAGSKELDLDGDFEIVLKSQQTIIEKDDYFKVKVTWRLKNKTGEALDNALIFFSELGPPPFFPDYEGRTVDLKSTGSKDFSVIRYSNDDGEDFAFLGWSLLDFEPGTDGMRKRKFKYRVEGDLVNRRTPALGVSTVFNAVPVPEPSTTILLATGFAAALASRPGRRPRRSRS
jgi:hypothetical protein